MAAAAARARGRAIELPPGVAPVLSLPIENIAYFPGLVLIVGPTGAVEAALGTAAPGDGMLPSPSPLLANAIARVAASGRAETELVESPGGATEPLEATLLPLTHGRVVVLLRPLTLEHTLRARLLESRQRYKDLVEAVADFAWETGRDGNFCFISPGGALDWAAGELAGRPPTEFVAAEDRAVFTAKEPLRDVGLGFRRADGAVEWLSVSALPLFDGEGEWCGARGVARAHTDARDRARETAERALQDRLGAHLARVAGRESDPEKALTAALAAAANALGASGAALLAAVQPGLAIAHGGAAETARGEAAEALARTRDGSGADRVAGHVLVGTTRGEGGANGVVVLVRDADQPGFADEDRAALVAISGTLGTVLAQQNRLAEAVTLARVDPLTGLLNRRGFSDELMRRLMARRPESERRGTAPARRGCLVYVDVDNFKLVNDNVSHEAGDAALLEIARLLRAQARAPDLIARLGGDEFALWLDGPDAEVAGRRGNALVEAAKALADRTRDPSRPLSLSVGIAAWDVERPETADALMARADAAMYQAKKSGKGRVAAAPPTGDTTT